jgi:glycosyltransferase involved in cell wall biosynthesis
LKFLAVGGGELQSDLNRMVCDLGLQNSVVFTGWQMDLAKIYTGLDIVCLTSLNEGTPLTLIEAMAAGKPFVATDVGGVRDLMVGERTVHPSGFEIFANGILTPSNNSHVLSAALSFLMEDPVKRLAMGKAGQQCVIERYSSDRLLEETGKLYLELLDAKL